MEFKCELSESVMKGIGTALLNLIDVTQNKIQCVIIVKDKRAANTVMGVLTELTATLSVSI